MPSPRLPSLKFSSIYEDAPYQGWFALAKTLDEHLSLIETFNGIPKEWVQWTDKKIESCLKRGVIIENPLAYRLCALWNGIILLQEGKFLCDSIENALRNCFIIHANHHNYSLKDLIALMPNKDKWSKILMTATNNSDANNKIYDFTFGELIQLLLRNWNKVGDTGAEGFVMLFYYNKACRDGSLFRNDMSYVRKTRNDIAHIKRLFLPNETAELFKIAKRWLTPLNIDIEFKIVNYRKSRPKFLDDLSITSVMHNKRKH